MRRAALIACGVTVVVTALPAGAVARVPVPMLDPVSARPTLGLRPSACPSVPEGGFPTALPVGASPCPGVRPGSAVRSDAGLCTLNFVFEGSDGDRYVATSAQCVEAFIGERVPAPGRRVVARDAAGHRIGEFVYAVFDRGADFALIRLDPAVPASPEMCHFGGPTGLNEDRRSEPVVLHYYGSGTVAVDNPAAPEDEDVSVGPIAPGRSSVALGLDDPDWVLAQGTALYGDIGSAVITADGRAVGMLVFAGLVRRGTQSGTLGIIRLGPQVARAENRLGIELELLTAPTHFDSDPSAVPPGTKRG
jgi:hypothetical protein